MSKILRSPNPRSPSEIPLEPIHKHIFNTIQQSLKQHGDYLWMEDVSTGYGIKLSQVIPSVRSVTSALKRRGFNKGDILCVYSSNVPHFFLPVLATWACGGVLCPGNTNSTAVQISRLLEDTCAKVVICDEERLPTILEATKRMKNYCNDKVDHIFVFGKSPNLQGTAEEFNCLLEDDGKAYPTSLHIDVKHDPAFLVFSSGTTGLPKGVVHTHFSSMATLTQYPTVVTPSMNLVMTNWFFHVSGFYISLLWIGKQVTIYTFSQYNDDLLLKTIHEKKPTILSLYPHQVVMLYKDPKVCKYDLSTVVFVVTGGAVLPTEAQKGICKRFPNLKGVSQAYAMSECLGITSTIPMSKGELNYQDQPAGKLGGVGFVAPFSSVKISDEQTGRACGPNESGEICVKSPCMMIAYRNKPQETRRVLDKDGWLRTGDVGYYDEDGQVFFVEREKELLKFKSHQIAPAALESLILQHPGVLDVAVVGVADDEGELPRAFVVRSSEQCGIDLQGNDIIRFVHDRVADHEQLRGGVVFIETLPRNPTGKILRKELKDKCISQDNFVVPA